MRRINIVEGFKESFEFVATILALDLLLLPPGHLVGFFQHVVSIETRDGHDGNSGGVVADLLDVSRDFLVNFLESVFGIFGLGAVHLVDSNDHLLDTESEAEEHVLTGLSILGDTSFEFSSTSSDNQHGTIGLRCTSDHVLDEITMSRGINDGDEELGGLEFPESNINGDTTFTFGLQLVEYPGIFEGALSHFTRFLLELLNGTLVDTTALVDEMASGGGLAGVDVTDDHDGNMDLFLTHVGDSPEN